MSKIRGKDCANPAFMLSELMNHARFAANHNLVKNPFSVASLAENSLSAVHNNARTALRQLLQSALAAPAKFFEVFLAIALMVYYILGIRRMNHELFKDHNSIDLRSAYFHIFILLP
jgi:hypothetical protein